MLGGCGGQIAEAEQLEDSTRQLAAEFLVTLCEAREKAPGMMRKLPQLVARLFQCLVTFLLDVEVGHCRRSNFLYMLPHMTREWHADMG
jgi:hypothetical protein